MTTLQLKAGGLRRRATVLFAVVITAFAVLVAPAPGRAAEAEVRVVDNSDTTPNPTTGAVFTKVRGFGGTSGAATGQVGVNSSYSWASGDAVRWSPNLARSASVRIWINRVVYQPDVSAGIADDNASLAIVHNGRKSVVSNVNLNGGTTGYLELGTFDFAGSPGAEYVSLTKANGRTTRVDAVKFEITYRSAPIVEDYAVTTAPGTAVSGTVTGSDPDGEELQYRIASGPSHGSVSLADENAGTWTYQPADGFAGADTFQVEVRDHAGLTALSTVEVDVAVPGNAKPVLQAISPAETTLNRAVSGVVRATDPEGEALTFAIAGEPGHGTVALAADGPQSTRWTYTPDSNYLGADTFAISVTDGNSAPVPANVAVTVVRGTENRPPRVEPSAVDAISGWTKTGTIEATDPDGDAIVSYSLVIPPRRGTVRDTGNYRVWHYASRPKFVGPDSFTIRVTDALGGSTDVTVRVTVSKPSAVTGAVPRGYELSWADEFNAATVNEDDWYYRFGANRAPDPKINSAQRAENVSIVRDPNNPTNGLAQIDLKKEEYVLPTTGETYHYTGGGLITDRAFSYGYYEVRAKFFDRDGWHSAFWTADGSSTRTEIDGFEHDSSHPSELRNNVITWNPSGLTLTSGNFDAGFDASADFHVYGFDWTPYGVAFYVDNKLTHFARYPAYMHEHGAAMVWLTAIAINMGGDHAIDGVDLTTLNGKQFGTLGSIQFDYFRYYAPSSMTNNVALQSVATADSSLQPVTNPSLRQNAGAHYNPPAKAVDGGRSGNSDRWVSADNDDAHWLTIDLGERRRIRQVKFWTGDNGYNAPLANYRIQYSTTGGTSDAEWTDIVSRTGNTESFVDEEFPEVRTRYLRLYVPPGQGKVALFDFQAYERPVHDDQDSVYNPGGVASPQLETVYEGQPAIIVDPFHSQYSEIGPGWSGSGVSGYDGTGTRYTLDFTEATKSATWTPIVAETGEYDVYYFRVADVVTPSRNDPNVRLDIRAGAQTVTQEIDLSVGESGWVLLGRYTLAAGTGSSVTATKSEVPTGIESVLRTSGVMFVRR